MGAAADHANGRRSLARVCVSLLYYDQLSQVEQNGGGVSMKRKNMFTVSHDDLVLHLEPADEGGYIVTSPFEPELITEAESLEDAFVMARDAIKALRASRVKLHRKLGLSKGIP